MLKLVLTLFFVLKVVHGLEASSFKISSEGGGSSTANMMKRQFYDGTPLNSLPIKYHNGYVITADPVHVNVIFYGSQYSTQSKNLLTSFLTNLGTSEWWNIARQYCSSSAYPCVGATVSNITLGGVYTDSAYSLGKDLTDDDIFSLVVSAYTNNHFAPYTMNTKDLTIVLTDKTVNKTGGFCTQFCGWHSGGSSASTGFVNIYYSFVGSADYCTGATGCSPFGAISEAPNGDIEMDSMIGTIAHEIAEFVTDPDGTAWWDTQGNENADKCAWYYGAYSVNNGRYYNEIVGNTTFLVQNLWGLVTPSGNGQGCQNGGPMLYPSSQLASPTKTNAASFAAPTAVVLLFFIFFCTLTISLF